MRLKTVFSIALLLFVAVSILVLVANELKGPAGGSMAEGGSSADIEGSVGADGGPDTRMSEQKLIVYYFHGTTRCPTCLMLEAYSKEAVETIYAGQLEAGTMEWQVVNYDESWNEHFLSDYNLAFQSLVLVKKQGQEESFTNLERIWHLVGDKSAYFEYVRNSIDSVLEAQ